MFRLRLVTVVILISIVSCEDLEELWKQWTKTYKKAYTRSELSTRRLIWERTHMKIQNHNREADQGTHTYRMAHNEFSDLTFEEFSSKYLGAKVADLIESKTVNSPKSRNTKKRQTLPSSVDYTGTIMVNPVQDQGICGCCYAFAATGALEGQYAKTYGKSIVLSAQQLAECDKGANQYGCNGGMYDRSWNYIMKVGLATESSYPYNLASSFFTGTCKFTTSMKFVNLTRWTYTSNNYYDENALATAIANVGPIAVSVYVTSAFQSYSSGIFSDKNCNVVKTAGSYSYPDINHAVVAVGYGVDSSTGKSYWLLKNQWGKSWGMNGYMKIERDGLSDICHVASWAAYPIGVYEINSIATSASATSTATKTSSSSTSIKTTTKSSSSGIKFELITLLILLAVQI